jgi:hypothetical protein
MTAAEQEAVLNMMAKLPLMFSVAYEFEHTGSMLTIHFKSCGPSDFKFDAVRLNIVMEQRYAMLTAEPQGKLMVKFANVDMEFEPLGEVRGITIQEHKPKPSLYGPLRSIAYEGKVEVKVLDTELLKQLLGIDMDEKPAPAYLNPSADEFVNGGKWNKVPAPDPYSEALIQQVTTQVQAKVEEVKAQQAQLTAAMAKITQPDLLEERNW